MAQKKTVTEKEIQKQEEKIIKLSEQLEAEKKKLADLKSEFNEKTKSEHMAQLENAIYGSGAVEKISITEIMAFIKEKKSEGNNEKSAISGTSVTQV